MIPLDLLEAGIKTPAIKKGKPNGWNVSCKTMVKGCALLLTMMGLGGTQKLMSGLPGVQPEGLLSGTPTNPFTAASCAESPTGNQYEPYDLYSPLNATDPDILPYSDPPCQSQWPGNTEVFASSSQNHFSYITRSRGSYYSAHLLNCITSNLTDSLGECHAGMRFFDKHGWHGSGYSSHNEQIQFPVSSADALDGQCLNTWNKKDTHKKRFALLLSGDKRRLAVRKNDPHSEHNQNNGTDLNDLFDQDGQKWKQALEDTYPNTTVFYYPKATYWNIRQGLQKINRMIRRQSLSPDTTEVMLYFVGHGQASQPEDQEVNREGDAVGGLELQDGLSSENVLKRALMPSRKFQIKEGIPISIIINACQSGAFIK